MRSNARALSSVEAFGFLGTHAHTPVRVLVRAPSRAYAYTTKHARAASSGARGKQTSVFAVGARRDANAGPVFGAWAQLMGWPVYPARGERRLRPARLTVQPAWRRRHLVRSERGRSREMASLRVLGDGPARDGQVPCGWASAVSGSSWEPRSGVFRICSPFLELIREGAYARKRA